MLGVGGGGTEDIAVSLSCLRVLMSEWLEVSLSPPHTKVHRMKFVLKPLGYSPPLPFWGRPVLYLFPPLLFHYVLFWSTAMALVSSL